MRLASLEDFRSRIYMPGSAPAIDTLRRHINLGLISGGQKHEGRYSVDMQAFFRAQYPGLEFGERKEKPRQTHVVKVRRIIPAAELAEMDAAYDNQPKDHLKASAAHSRKRKRIIIHCGRTWDMHLCDGRDSCPVQRNQTAEKQS